MVNENIQSRKARKLSLRLDWISFHYFENVMQTKSPGNENKATIRLETAPSLFVFSL